MILTYQRIRNLTTGILHTKVEDIYKDIGFLTGEKGMMTHHLPAACQALKPFLKERFPDERFWDKQFDVDHVGEIEVNALNETEKNNFFKAFNVGIQLFWDKITEKRSEQ